MGANSPRMRDLVVREGRRRWPRRRAAIQGLIASGEEIPTRCRSRATARLCPGTTRSPSASFGTTSAPCGSWTPSALPARRSSPPTSPAAISRRWASTCLGDAKARAELPDRLPVPPVGRHHRLLARPGTASRPRSTRWRPKARRPRTRSTVIVPAARAADADRATRARDRHDRPRRHGGGPSRGALHGRHGGRRLGADLPRGDARWRHPEPEGCRGRRRRRRAGSRGLSPADHDPAPVRGRRGGPGPLRVDEESAPAIAGVGSRPEPARPRPGGYRLDADALGDLAASPAPSPIARRRSGVQRGGPGRRWRLDQRHLPLRGRPRAQRPCWRR